MKKKSLTGVLVLLVFAAFTVSVLSVLLTGADLVRGITLRDRRGYDLRTAEQYLTTRVRRADRAGAILAEEGHTLVLREDVDGACYETRIYCYGGSLRELYCEAGYALGPEFGEEILPVEELRVAREGSLLYLSFRMPDGEESSLLLHIRSEGEVPG